ncbi:MAG: class I SAM-dependent methyltransferase [Magnetococcus sp. DMHC-6]
MSDQIEYYLKIQPFQRDVADLKLFLNRRSALYRHLGIVPKFIFQQSILEFGPGFGENAIFPLLQKPSRYLFVDAIENCLEKTRERLTSLSFSETQLEYRLSSIENFMSTELFDLVICESVIPREPQPEILLAKVAESVSIGGVLVITCQDPVSTFAELLRRLLALLVVDPEESLEAKLKRLLPLFDPHLKTIQGMTRSSSDWILDNLLRPWESASFSIPDAIHTLKDRFDIHGTSPRFILDSRWFRTIHEEDFGFHAVAEKSYYANVHNLINHRVWTPSISEQLNKTLLELCSKIFQEIQAFEEQRDRQLVWSLLGDLQQVIDLAAIFSEDTERALRDYHRVLQKYLQEGVLDPFVEFAPLFGRGQQYVSFIRRC